MLKKKQSMKAIVKIILTTSFLINRSSLIRAAIVMALVLNSQFLIIHAQVGINDDNSSPDASAMLDVKSTAKGMLVPRMTASQRDLVSSPATGLMIYNTSTKAFNFYNGIAWIAITAGNTTELADSDNDTKIQVEESADEDSIRFDIMGSERLVLRQNGNGMTMMSLPNTSKNVFLGENAGLNTSGIRNLFIGNQTGYSNTTGSRNMFIGSSAGYSNTTGTQNTFIGEDAGLDNTTGNFNLFIGATAGSKNTTGYNNIFFGGAAGGSTTDGKLNLFIGTSAGYSNVSGENNVYLGTLAGVLSTGSNNVFLGHNAGYNELGSNKLYIENSDITTPLIYGDFSTDLLRINGTLNINNAFSFPTTDGTTGQVLKTDGSGNLSWSSDLATDNLGNHTATVNIQTNSQYISNDGTDNGIFIDGSNNIGINTATPKAKFDANGTIIAGAAGTLHNTTLSGTEGILMPGITSDYNISVQDGNGRVQHKWNATHGLSEKFIVGGEDAFFIDLTGTADDNTPWIEFKHADGASAIAGDAISWNTQMIINQSGRVGINELIPDDRLHITDGGDGTRVRLENTGNGWAGVVAKNSVREIFIGIQGAFDVNPGEFHIFDNIAGARRMVIDAAGEVGIGVDNPSVKLDVNGSVNCTGGTCSSDIRWKKDIQPLSNSLSNIVKLQGVTYHWRTDEFSDKDFSSDQQIGFIAQEVEKVYPELVKTNNEGYKSMDYMSITAILLEGIKEQQQIIEQQQELITTLQQEDKTQQNTLEAVLKRIEALEELQTTDKKITVDND